MFIISLMLYEIEFFRTYKQRSTNMPVSIDYSPRTKGNILVENKKVIDIYEVSYGEDGMILVGKEYKIVFKLSAKYLKV